MRLGDIVSIAGYAGRKVGVVVGYTSTFKYRLRVLRVQSRRWTLPTNVDPGRLSPAPADWPATKLARELLSEVWP